MNKPTNQKLPTNIRLSFSAPKSFNYEEPVYLMDDTGEEAVCDEKTGKPVVDHMTTVVKVVYNCKVIDITTHEVMKEFKVESFSYTAEGDDFEERYGKILADSRAKAQAYKIARDMFSPYDLCKMEAKVKLYTDFLNFYKKMQHLKQSEDRHLQHVINHAND